MTKWNLIVDVAECHNCNNCVIACKDEHVGNDRPGYSAPQPLHGHRWIDIKTRERGRFPHVEVNYLPTMCNHCDNAPCVVQGNGAVIKRDDGIVIIDPAKAKGRLDIAKSCPYGAIWWNDTLDLPQAWTFDAHLLDSGWQYPRCVQSCPTGAMRAIKVADQEMARLTVEENLETLQPELKTKPRVYYKNLFRFFKIFVAGEVLVNVDDTIDCAADAQVTLSSGGTSLGITQAGTFGEFTLDDIAPQTGACELTVSHRDFPPQTIALDVADESLVVDTIVLNRNQ